MENMKTSLRTMQAILNGDQRLFNSLLVHDGLKIVGVQNSNQLGNTIQNEAVVAIASMLTESIYDPHEMTSRQRSLQHMAESRGYMVALIEGMDQCPGTEINPIKGMLNHPDDEEEQAPAEGEEGEDGPPMPPQ